MQGLDTPYPCNPGTRQVESLPLNTFTASIVIRVRHDFLNDAALRFIASAARLL